MTALQQFYDELQAMAGRERNYAETAEHYPYALPESALEFDNISAVKQRVISGGSHYFDPQAIRFFHGRTDRQLYGRRFWVESRKFENYSPTLGYISEPREYQVAYVYACGNNLSIEKLGSFDTLDKARKAAKKLAALVTRAHMDAEAGR